MLLGQGSTRAFGLLREGIAGSRQRTQFSLPQPESSPCCLKLCTTLVPPLPSRFVTTCHLALAAPSTVINAPSLVPRDVPRPVTLGPASRPGPGVPWGQSESHAGAMENHKSNDYDPGKKGRSWGLAIKSSPNSNHDNQPVRGICTFSSVYEAHSTAFVDSGLMMLLAEGAHYHQEVTRPWGSATLRHIAPGRRGRSPTPLFHS